MAELLDYHVALKSLLENHPPLGGEESVPLMELHQRVLARDVLVQHDVPAFDNSAMDGYAVNGNEHESWEVVQRIAAGDQANVALQPGQAARIFTGAPVPAGTTAVIMQEHVVLDADARRIKLGPDAGRGVKDGQNIRYKAEELQQGKVLMPAHQSVSAAAIGLLSTQGYTHVPCFPQLRITVFSSGNELVEPGKPLAPGQIYDSNRQMVSAMLRAEGFMVLNGGILPDRLDATREALQRAAKESDAIVCSGGVSVGEEDHLKNALAEVGELTQWRLHIKPGKPITWGRIGDCRVFMLPGNPVSSLVTLRQLALPALKRMSGLPEAQSLPWKIPARADFSRDKIEARREFMRVTLEATADGLRAKPVALQGSNMLSGAVFATAVAEIPPGAKIEPGLEIDVYPLAERF